MLAVVAWGEAAVTQPQATFPSPAASRDCVTREQEDQLHPCSKTELAEDHGSGQPGFMPLNPNACQVEPCELAMAFAGARR